MGNADKKTGAGCRGEGKTEANPEKQAPSLFRGFLENLAEWLAGFWLGF